MAFDAKARLFVTQALEADGSLTVSGKQAHYLTQVMRIVPGQSLVLFNGTDGEWLAEVVAADKREVVLMPRIQRRAQTASPDHWLLFAPIKGDRIDGMAEKATELGVSALLPVKTARTVISRVNEDRLRATVIEAAEQSERLDVPAIHPFRPLEDWLSGWEAERLLILCDETGQGAPPDVALPPHRGRKAAVLIGPEGGFATAELERLRALPYVLPMTLGPRVLRADTAAMAALTVLQLFLGDWDRKPAFGA